MRERIKQVRLMQNLSQEDFALRLGFSSKGHISALEKGAREITKRTVADICREFNVSKMWLEDGIGEMFIIPPATLLDTLKEQYSLDELDEKLIIEYAKLTPEQKMVIKQYMNNVFGSKFELNEEKAAREKDYSVELPDELAPYAALRSIPLYLLPASAGTGEFLDSDYFESVDVGADVPLSANFGVRISGNSMEPDYPNGCIAWVKRTMDVREGQIGVFICDGEGFIKKLGRNKLISLNPKYHPKDLTEFTDFRICGLVVGVTNNTYK